MLNNVLLVVGIISFSVIFGIVLEKIFKVLLMKIAKKSKIQADNIIIGAFKGIVLLWSILAGIYISLLVLFGNAIWINQIVKALITLVILSITILIKRISKGFVSIYSKKVSGMLPSTSIFENIINVFVYIIGILVALQYLGISITPIITALGIGGLAVALALQDTLSNVFAGINILLSQQIKPGNYIKLDSGQEGFIEDISWKNTSVRMMSNNMILIPNSKLSSAVITNHELPETEMGLIVDVGVSYSSDLEKVEKIVCEVGQETMKQVQGGVANFKPFIRYNSFSESSIDFGVILRVKSFTDQYLVKHEFIKLLHKRFNQEGIKIPFPIRTVHLENSQNN